MTRYCAQCGSSLGAAALHAGYCTICRTAIAADVRLDPNDGAVVDSTTQPVPSVYAAAGGVIGASGTPDPHASSAHTTPA
jgi:hypothetical protein